MDSSEMIKSRYTTKNYDKEYKITSEIREKIIEVLRCSPSSINSQPWRFYFVENKDLKNQLAEFSLFNKEKVQDSSLLIVFSALTAKEFKEQYVMYGAEGSKAYFDTYIKNKPPEEIETWLTSQVYLSLGFLLATLGFEGVDSTPLEGIELKKYSETLKVDEDKERVLFALAIGRRAEDDQNQPSITDKIRLDKDVTIKELL